MNEPAQRVHGKTKKGPQGAIEEAKEGDWQ